MELITSRGGEIKTSKTVEENILDEISSNNLSIETSDDIISDCRNSLLNYSQIQSGHKVVVLLPYYNTLSAAWEDAPEDIMSTMIQTIYVIKTMLSLCPSQVCQLNL